MRLCLRRRFPPSGNLELPHLLILLIQINHKAIRWCHGEFIDLADKAKNVWLLVRQLPKKAGLWDAHNALRDFSRSNKDYGNAMSRLWPGALRVNWCCGHKEGCYIPTSLPYWFLTKSSQYQSWKAKLFPALSGSNLRLSEFKTNVPPIMLLKHNMGILKHIPNIKSLQWNPNSISLPSCKAA